MGTAILKSKRLLSILPLLFISITSYGQGQENAIGFFINSIIFFLFLLTAISIFFGLRFYLKRKGSYRVIAILLSVVMLLVSAIFLLVSTWGPPGGGPPDHYYQEMVNIMQLIGFSLLLLNAPIVLFLPWMNSSTPLEVIIGRLDEDRRIITWASIKRVNNTKTAVGIHKVIDNGERYSNFYHLTPIGKVESEEKHIFNNVQEAVEYLRNLFKNEGLRFVQQGNLQTEYKMLLRKERN